MSRIIESLDMDRDFLKVNLVIATLIYVSSIFIFTQMTKMTKNDDTYLNLELTFILGIALGMTIPPLIAYLYLKYAK